ncbi:MAG: PAS domain S-box protein [Cyanobacteria bacterium SBLK]|nr:PAS domain S-box protein [Cyanobacteria bacterium SBLK]
MSKNLQSDRQRITELEEENQRGQAQLAQLQQRFERQSRELQRVREALERLQEGMSDSERFLRAAVDSIPQAVFWKDRDSVYLGGNQYIARVVGLSSTAEIVGKTDDDLPWTTEEAEFYRECDRRIMESGIPELGIVESQQQANGGRRWSRTNKIPVRDEEGRVIGILGIFIDITDRIEANQQLQHQAIALENAADGISIFAQDRYIYVNRAHIKMFGYASPEELLGKSWQMLYDAEEIKRFRRDIWPVVEQQGTWRGEATARREDGSNFSQELSLTRTQSGTIVCICRNISDRKRIEKEQQRLLSILEATPDIIGIADDRGNNIYLNRAGQNALEISSEECDRFHISEFHPPEIHQKIASEAVPIAIQTGIWQGESILRTRNGREFPVWQTILAHKDDKGNLECLSTVMRDIGDRKDFEAALVESEERYRLVCEQTGQVIYDYDLASGIIIWAGAILAITGYSAEEFQAFDVHDWEQLIHPDDRILAMEQLAAAMTECSPYRAEYRWRQKDGSYIYVEDSGVFLTAESGEPERMLGTLNDISNRKAAEEELLLFKRAVESSSDAIALFDPRGNLMYQNPAYACLYDCDTIERFMETGGIISCYPDFKVCEEMVQTILNGQSWTNEAEQRSRNGRYFPAIIRANGIQDTSGELLGLIGIITDISQQKQTEIKLQQQEQFLRSVYDGVAHPIFVVDVSPSRDFRYAGCNTACERVTRTKREEIIGKTPQDWMGETAGAEICDRFNRCLDAGEPLTIEECLAFGSEKTWWQTTLIPLSDRDGQIYRIVGTTFNISESKQAKIQIQEQEQLLRSIYDGVSHPIFVIDVLPDGNFHYISFNQMARRILGKTHAETTHRTPEDIFSPEQARNVRQTLSDCIAREQLLVQEDCLNFQGRDYWFLTSLNPLKDATGRIYRLVGTALDISDRKAAESALQESEAFNRYLFEEFPVGLALCRTDGQLVQINLAYADIIGRTISETLELTYWDITPEKYSDREAEQLQRLQETGRYGPYEKEYIHKDGHLVPVVLSGLMVEKNGESLIWSSIADISDRKAAEQRLRQSEERFRGLVETLNDWIWECDRHGVYTYVSPQIETILGYSAREAIGKTPFDFMPEEAAQKVRDIFAERTSAGEAIEQIETINIHKDGHRVILETSGVPIFDGDGNVQGYRGIDRDISDRKAAEKRLKQQEAQYRQIFETIVDGLGIVDLERGELVEVNPAYYQMHGYSRAEFMALPYTDIVHPNSHPFLAQFIEDIRVGRVFTCQAQNIHRDGSLIDVDVKGIPFPYRDKLHALALIRDISEKGRLERDRDRREQALRSIVEGTAAQTGEGFFRACVKSLALALEVSHVLVAEIEYREERAIANAIAFWTETDFGDNFQYDLSATPCYNVFESGSLCRYNNAVQSHFPDDPYLAPLNAESYVGIPLVDSQETVVGLIAVLHTEPLEDSEIQSSILEIFAARAGAEIERLRSEKALQDKDTLLQMTLATGKMGCWSWNRHTNAVTWSDGVETILGLPSGYFGGKLEDFLALVHPEEREKVLQSIDKAFATEGEYNLEHRILLPDGNIQWLRATGGIWRNEKGEAIGLVGSVLNDTQRKNAEIALIESAEQIHQQALQEQLLNQIANQIRTSLDLHRILDTTVREIQRFLEIDRCHFAWYVRDAREAYWNVIAEVCKPNLPSFVGQHHAANFGALSELLLRQQILRLDDAAMVRDSALREALTELGNQSLLVLPVRSESGNFGIIACIHHQAARPWQDDEVEFLEAVVAQVAIALNQSDLLAQSQERARELEVLLTQLQRTQTQLIQSEKMSSLGQMVAGVAHEINNPVSFIHGNIVHANEYMNDVMGLLDLYRKHYPQPHPDICNEIDAIDFDFLKEDLQKIFQSMRVGTDRIQEIVKSLRTFSRLDEAEVKDVNLHEGIDSTLMILQTRLRAQDWRPKIAVIKDYGQLPRVQCYAGQLNQVFMNIISNAIDALEERDRDRTPAQMEENPSQIRIKTRQKGNTIAIRIRDNGPGMSETTRAKLFDPFFTTKGVGKGTGLGLSISYQIVTEKHNGRLSCLSDLGNTTFIIEIPIASEF